MAAFFFRHSHKRWSSFYLFFLLLFWFIHLNFIIIIRSSWQWQLATIIFVAFAHSFSLTRMPMYHSCRTVYSDNYDCDCHFWNVLSFNLLSCSDRRHFFFVRFCCCSNNGKESDGALTFIEPMNHCAHTHSSIGQQIEERNMWIWFSFVLLQNTTNANVSSPRRAHQHNNYAFSFYWKNIKITKKYQLLLMCVPVLNGERDFFFKFKNQPWLMQCTMFAFFF